MTQTKETTSNNQNNSENKKWPWVVGIVVSILAAGGIVGIIVFVVMDARLAQEQSLANQTKLEAENLRNQIAISQTDQATSNTSDNTASNNTTTATTDSRTLLTLDNAATLQEQLATTNGVRDCSFSSKFNQDPATTSVAAKDQALGVTVDVPYNPAWGTSDLRIEPFEEVASSYSVKEANGKVGTRTATAIMYGPFGVTEGCGWARPDSVRIIPKRTLAQIKEVARLQNPTPLPDSSFKSLIINGLTAVEYKLEGLCGDAFLEILGQNNNYILNNQCQVDFSTLEKVAKTLQPTP